MDRITHEIRLKNWMQIIERCQARSQGQSAKQWLSDNGINEKTYYYWLRKIRKLTYEQANTETALSQTKDKFSPISIKEENELQVSFAEVPFNVNTESLCTGEKNFQPAAVVTIASVSLSFSNEANPELVAGIIREVMDHA